MVGQIPFFIWNDSLKLLPLVLCIRYLLDVCEGLHEGLVAFQVLWDLWGKVAQDVLLEFIDFTEFLVELFSS